MRNSVSERGLIIESDDKEVEQQQRRRGDEEGSSSDSVGSGSSTSSCATPRRGSVTAASASSYTHQWPQSYRQSIDILSSVQSPNLSFLGTPTLTRLSNSFLNSSFRGKTPEVISNLVKPLLRPTTSDEQEQPRQQQHEDTRESSQYLLPSSRKPSLDQIPEDQASSNRS